MVELQDEFQNHGVERSCLPALNTCVKLLGEKKIKLTSLRPYTYGTLFVVAAHLPN